MEDKRNFFECVYCDGEFAVDTDCSMDILYCPFCSEPLDIPLSDEPEDYYEEV